MTENINPLAAFFCAVLSELRKQLKPEELADLLKECDVDSEN
ncbi:hypothetical protein ES708_19427 [subsurface metagenome]